MWETLNKNENQDTYFFKNELLKILLNTKKEKEMKSVSSSVSTSG